MIKTERKSFDFPIEYLLTKEAVDKAADVFIDKFEELGLIESYWVNYSLYWFCKNHLDHHPSMSCECCAKVKEELQNEEDHLYAGIRIRAMESTIKFISERLEPSLLNKSFCDYFKNVRFENTTFSKNDGLLKDISPLLEKQYKEIVLLTISNFEIFTSSEGYKESVRFDYLNSLMNFLFPPKFGDSANSNFTQERNYVNFNHLLMDKSQRKILGYDLDSNKHKEHKDSGGFVVSFYCKYYNELVNSIKDDGGNIKKEKVNLILNFLEFAIETGINENYFTTNTIQNIFELINKLKEVFPDTKSPLISVSKNKYPETYSFLNTMIDGINFDSFKDNNDFKTYYDRNDVILRYETLEAPKLVTKEELLKYLCLEE